jgi:hypothetical protein
MKELNKEEKELLLEKVVFIASELDDLEREYLFGKIWAYRLTKDMTFFEYLGRIGECASDEYIIGKIKKAISGLYDEYSNVDDAFC